MGQYFFILNFSMEFYVYSIQYFWMNVNEEIYMIL